MAEREAGSRVAAVVLAVAVLVVVVIVALDHPAPAPESTPAGATATAESTTTITTTSPTAADPVLPRRPDGFGEVLPTPPELVDRRRTAPDVLPPPASGQYEASIAPISAELLPRTTWRPGCPVPPERLRYLRMSFWGFDDRTHTGEMIVRDDVAEPVVGVFRKLFAARFPIEAMRLAKPEDLTALPTGRGNGTAAFACRAATGQTRFSAHASGLAIDVNPFQNPLERRDGLVVPELASAYTDRSWRRPGMIAQGDVVTEAFAAIGWTWGATFSAPKDTMHFSQTGT
ncbi:M15 family metallopeptidase [Actinomycetospora sp. CA-101289]|uniref:M15 family metallopeptidase n=1 Tax=Actinomycetospora sp. CA-101289 TaxID=3239893 RepID=UPI003D98613D